MKKNKLILVAVTIILSIHISGKNTEKTDTFQAILHKVEVSSDLYQPSDTLLVTCWFQNIGESPSSKPLGGFAELSFGHQRILENTLQYHRFYWDLYPETNQWKPGEVWKTTFKCKMELGWGGSYTIHIGLCDENHIPVKIKGLDGSLQEQVNIGDIDLGWSWGTPTMDQVRKPWSKVINPLITGKEDKAHKLSETLIGTSNTVSLNAAVPEILKVNQLANNKETRGMLPVVSIRDYVNDCVFYSSEQDIDIKYTPIQESKNKINYKGKVIRQKDELAEYILSFEMIKDELSITLSDIKEKSGYELLEVNIPSLLSLDGNDVEIANFTGGGRLISLEKAIPEGYSFKYDTRNAAALLRPNMQLVMESMCIDDRLNIAIYDNGETKTANLGMVLVNKVRGKGKIASIPVEHNHAIKISLLDKSWGNDSWQAVARYLRNDLKTSSRDLYRRALIYKQLATSGPEPPAGYVKEDSPYPIKRLQKCFTFKEIFDMVKMNYYVLDGMPQVLYIGGFQEGGFDNSYPYVFNTDSRVGTVDELRNYIQEAKKYNTILSMHDNYDSDVVNSPYYDPRIACMDAEGKPWMGWFWAGGVDHIVAPYKYAELGLMQERVKKTVDLYGVGGSYHLDVLTSELLRYDFDPEYPASAQKSLEGKYRIIDEFNKYGIDVTSETLLHPFVGHTGFGLHARTDLNATFFNGEKFIPILDMVYHGTVPYGGGGRNDEAMLMGLMKGSSIFISEENISEDDVKWIYLHQIPVGLLYDKKMEKIEESGRTMKVIYDKDTYVKVNFADKSYEVKVDGQCIAKDWTTFLPGFKENIWLAYSVKGGSMPYDIPKEWNNQTKLNAVTLTFEGDGQEIPCKIENGKLSINMPAATPVRITYSK